jgi:hypothetical protein
MVVRMQKIDSLTPEQSARMAEFSDKWIKIGLSTEPADRPKAEAAIAIIYKIAGLKAPRIIWCSSPMAMALTRFVVQKVDSVGANVWPSVEASVRASVAANVWDSVAASVWDRVGASIGVSVAANVWESVGASIGTSIGARVGVSVRDSVRDSVGPNVWSSVRDGVRDRVWTSVWTSVRDSVRDRVWDSVRDSVYGQHEANWLAFYDFFRTVLGLKKQTEKLEGLVRLATSAGWALPHSSVCWVSERHCVVRQDDQKRIHCEDGPAILYPDGWAIYAWHGVTVPSEWITDKSSLSASTALGWKNIEQRRAACEIVGWDRILGDELNAKTIDKDPDPEIGELIEVVLPDAGPARFIRVLCATGRRFAIPVPVTLSTALEANAWTYDIPAPLLTNKENRT